MKNFDIVRTSEYVVTESKLVDSFKSKFENYKVEVDPNNYRETYIMSNGNEPVIRYQMQSQVRMTGLNQILVYFNFPVSFFIEDIRSTPYGHFNYQIMNSLCQELDTDNITSGELTRKIKDGQLGIPLLDRPNEFFIGSAHSLFSAHLAKFKIMPLYIQVPKNKKSWFMKMPSALFQEKQKPFIKEESKFTYLFYVDLENKNLWGKKSYHTDSSTVKLEIQEQEKDLNTYTKLL